MQNLHKSGQPFSTRRHGGRSGFTLVEMLVVIAIIALLMSLIFSATTAAMHSAKMTRCKSNLGQVGKACLVYANDHGGRFFPREGVERCVTEGMNNREVIPYFIKGAGFDDIEAMQGYIPDGLQVRYAWAAFPDTANLYNQEGFPASLFSTSDP